ncbi:protein of unknown function [Agrobacterium pusense]|uniref:Uncharacterized protein n=1 Tax=Agrobacterium pusense TaxID=648995 RepID=U4Q1Q5_9HYPH|nr:protein of unknown function [Agrobacterium pusense]
MSLAPVSLLRKVFKPVALRVDYGAQAPLPSACQANFAILRDAPECSNEIRILGGCLIKNLRIRSNCNVSVREETHANACYFCGFSGQRDDSGGHCRGD